MLCRFEGSAAEPVLESRYMQCKICTAESLAFGSAKVLSKHDVRYFRCPACFFVQTEEPYWLAEAYSTAIASLDVGIMQRNLQNLRVTSAIITLLFPDAARFLDFGAGHGVLVRMMRDKGFDFRWLDRHADNSFARGFEHQSGDRYDLLTAYEVMEHFVNPLDDFQSLLAYADNLLVSTLQLPDPAPQPPDWWYYAATTGQHISFYSRQSLAQLASRFGLHLVSDGQYHLFTRRPMSRIAFRFARSTKAASAINRIWRRDSLTDKDFERIRLRQSE